MLNLCVLMSDLMLLSFKKKLEGGMVLCSNRGCHGLKVVPDEEWKGQAGFGSS